VVPLNRRPGGLQAFKHVYPSGWPGGEPERHTHEGYDWLYVLSGRMRLLLRQQDVALAPNLPAPHSSPRQGAEVRRTHPRS
jgi:hypothetical protein